MAVYIIASYDVVNLAGYEEYVLRVVPLLAQHGAEILVADRAAHALEGEKRSVYVVLRFESEAAALAFYNDPAYEPVKQLRLDASTNSSLVMVREFVPPAA